jgi:hypothetical protein
MHEEPAGRARAHLRDVQQVDEACDRIGQKALRARWNLGNEIENGDAADECHVRVPGGRARSIEGRRAALSVSATGGRTRAACLKESDRVAMPAASLRPRFLVRRARRDPVAPLARTARPGAAAARDDSEEVVA